MARLAPDPPHTVIPLSDCVNLYSIHENLYILKLGTKSRSNRRVPGEVSSMTSAEGTPAAAILSASRISKSFGEIPVLFSIDFDIKPGEVHAIIGENGAGKSTLIKILSGFEQPTSGSIA